MSKTGDYLPLDYNSRNSILRLRDRLTCGLLYSVGARTPIVTQMMLFSASFWSLSVVSIVAFMCSFSSAFASAFAAGERASCLAACSLMATPGFVLTGTAASPSHDFIILDASDVSTHSPFWRASLSVFQKVQPSSTPGFTAPLNHWPLNGLTASATDCCAEDDKSLGVYFLSCCSAFVARVSSEFTMASSPIRSIAYPATANAANPNAAAPWSAVRFGGMRLTATSPSIANINTTNPIQLSVSGDSKESSSGPIENTLFLRHIASAIMLIFVGFFAGLSWRRK